MTSHCRLSHWLIYINRRDFISSFWGVTASPLHPLPVTSLLLSICPSASSRRQRTIRPLTLFVIKLLTPCQRAEWPFGNIQTKRNSRVGHKKVKITFRTPTISNFKPCLEFVKKQTWNLQNLSKQYMCYMKNIMNKSNIYTVQRDTQCSCTD